MLHYCHTGLKLLQNIGSPDHRRSHQTCQPQEKFFVLQHFSKLEPNFIARDGVNVSMINRSSSSAPENITAKMFSETISSVDTAAGAKLMFFVKDIRDISIELAKITGPAEIAKSHYTTQTRN